MSSNSLKGFHHAFKQSIASSRWRCMAAQGSHPAGVGAGSAPLFVPCPCSCPGLRWPSGLMALLWSLVTKHLTALRAPTHCCSASPCLSASTEVPLDVGFFPYFVTVECMILHVPLWHYQGCVQQSPIQCGETPPDLRYPTAGSQLEMLPKSSSGAEPRLWGSALCRCPPTTFLFFFP